MLGVEWIKNVHVHASVQGLRQCDNKHVEVEVYAHNLCHGNSTALFGCRTKEMAISSSNETIYAFWGGLP